MKRLFLKCLVLAQTHRLLRLLYRRRLIVVAYHGFTDKARHEGIENSQGKHLHIDVFRSHLEYLKRHYHVISLDQLVDHYSRGTSIPDRSVVITIDDGYRSVYTLAYPLLKEYGFPATVFLPTDFVEKRELLWPDRLEHALNRTSVTRSEVTIVDERVAYNLRDKASKMACDSALRSRLKLAPQESMPAILGDIERSLGLGPPAAANVPEIYHALEWPEILEMSQSGLMSFGSHTVSHVILSRCGLERARTELVLSRQLIEQQTGGSCTLFCYPNGRVGCFDERTKGLLREVGYSCGLTTVAGLNDEHSDPYELKRLSIEDRGNLDRFKLNLSGTIGHLDNVKRSMLRPLTTLRARR